MSMLTRPLTKADYDEIVQVIDRWWGGPTSALAHPIFFYELGRMARVVESDGLLVGFLFGFICPDAEVGYVHLVGIHPDYRRRGVGQAALRLVRGGLPPRGLQGAEGPDHPRERGERPLPPGARLDHGRDRGLRRARTDADRLHPQPRESLTSFAVGVGFGVAEVSSCDRPFCC